MADINTIAKQFTDFYYTTFDSNRAELHSLYVSHRWETSPPVRDLTNLSLTISGILLCSLSRGPHSWVSRPLLRN